MTKSKHATRARYVLGCRCRRCKKANSSYVYERQEILRKRGKCRRCEKKRDSKSSFYCNVCLEKARVR